MDYIIREMTEKEYPMLSDFLYQAIFIPAGVKPPPKSIIDKNELQVYIKDFGKLPADKCLVAVVDGKVIGAVWSRIMRDYGHIDDNTPSIAISLYKKYRNKGIGTEMTRKMLDALREDGHKKVSLSVQKANYAVKMYRAVGFETVRETNDEYIMAREL